MFYLIAYSTQNSCQDIKYQLTNAKKMLLEGVKLLSTKTELVFGCPASDLLSGSSNMMLDTINHAILNAPEIKNPYVNILINSGMKPIETVSSLDEIFNWVFIQGLVDDNNFSSVIKSLEELLEIVPEVCKILIESDNAAWIYKGFNSFDNIFKTAYMFIKRIETTKYSYEKIDKSMNSFVNKFFDELFDVFSLCIKYNKHVVHFPVVFMELIYRVISSTNKLENKLYQEHFYKFIDKILDLYEELPVENKYDKEYFFSYLKMLAVWLFVTNKKAPTFKKLFQVLVSNYSYNEKRSDYHYNMFETFGYPRYAERFTGIDFQYYLKFDNLFKRFIRFSTKNK